MSSQAVASAAIESMDVGVCPKCNSRKRLYELVVSIKGSSDNWRYNAERLCIECLCDSSAPALRISPLDTIQRKNERRAINKTARKRERRCAEEICGSTTPASGSGIAKGDARNDLIVVDDKFTKAAQYILKKLDLIKISTQAKRTGRTGVLKVGFEPSKLNVAVLDWEDFMELINERD